MNGTGTTRRSGRVLPVLAARIAALAILGATPLCAWPQSSGEPERADALRAALAAPVPRPVDPRLAWGKAALVDPAGVSAMPCAGCRDGGGPAKPLFPALAPGESYELRILKGAVSGFALRLSDGDSATNPDERLRIRISRQRIGVFWQRSF